MIWESVHISMLHVFSSLFLKLSPENTSKYSKNINRDKITVILKRHKWDTRIATHIYDGNILSARLLFQRHSITPQCLYACGWMESVVMEKWRKWSSCITENFESLLNAHISLSCSSLYCSCTFCFLICDMPFNSLCLCLSERSGSSGGSKTGHGPPGFLPRAPNPSELSPLSQHCHTATAVTRVCVCIERVCVCAH